MFVTPPLWPRALQDVAHIEHRVVTRNSAKLTETDRSPPKPTEMRQTPSNPTEAHQIVAKPIETYKNPPNFIETDQTSMKPVETRRQSIQATLPAGATRAAQPASPCTGSWADQATQPNPNPAGPVSMPSPPSQLQPRQTAQPRKR